MYEVSNLVEGKRENGDGNGTKQPLAVEQKIIDHISEISKNSRTTFWALIIACAYSYLTISTTNDSALLTNFGATHLPIIQVRVPVVWFYYFAPIILTGLFLYFHFYLERFWRAIIRLPLYHQEDGRGLDDYLYPWLISNTFIRGGNLKLCRNRPLLRFEYGLSLILGWWFIPIILLFFWARYLVAHEWRGTLLHSFLLVVTVAFAFRFYYLAKNAVIAVPDNSECKFVHPPDEDEALRFKPAQVATAVIGSLVLGGMITYLSLCAFQGSPAKDWNATAREGTSPFFISGTTLLKGIGISPFASIKGEKLVAKPENWQALLDKPDALNRYLETQNKLKLAQRNLRHLNAEHAFLPASSFTETSLDFADLQHAVLTASEMVNVSFRSANLRHADFQHAKIRNTRFENVFADVSRFNHTRFITENTNEKTTFSGDYYDAWFEFSRGDNLHFENANFRETHFKKAKIYYSSFKEVDLAGAKLEETEFLNNTFFKTDFSESRMQSADLSYSKFDQCTFFSTSIKYTTFEDAEVTGSRFDSLQKMPSGSGFTEDSTKSHALRNNLEHFLAFGIKFKNVHIHNTHFKSPDFRFAQFENVEFLNTKFSNADLSDTTFKNTDLSDVEFYDVDFSGADLEEVSGLSERHLQNMCGNDATKLPKGYKKIEPCIKKEPL